jgi:hypothetical protein
MSSKKTTPDEPYKEEVSKLLDLAKFAILALMICGGFLGSEYLL